MTNQNAIALKPSESQFTPEELRLISETVAPGATPKELQLFLHRCKLMQLNPLKPGQIHFVKYGQGPGTIVIGIEGFRSIAARSGKLSGIKRGALRNEAGELIGAWAEIYRSDWQHPAREEVPLKEYAKTQGPWKTMPETMIKKVAEAAALRMAFPDDLGGIYAQEEMDQAKPVIGSQLIVPEQPEEGDGTPHDQGYQIDFGKWNRRSLEVVYRNEGAQTIAGYIQYLEETAEKKNQAIDPNGKVGVFIREAEAFLAAMENGGGQ